MDYNYKELYKKQIQINVKEVLKDIDYDKYIKNNNFLVLFCYKKEY